MDFLFTDDVLKYDGIITLIEAPKILGKGDKKFHHLFIDASLPSQYSKTSNDSRYTTQREMIEALFDLIPNKVEYLSFSISGCDTPRGIITPLAHLLEKSHFVDLDLSYTTVTDETLEILLTPLRTSELESLNLSFTKITGKGLLKLASLTKSMENLRSLNIKGIELKKSDFKDIIQCLQQSHITKLKTSLDISLE